MEGDLKRITQNLTLPPESRERIRSRLASYHSEQEDKTMKKVRLKARIPLIAAVVVIAMTLALTTAAAVTGILFRNSMIVSSKEDPPAPESGSGMTVYISPNVEGSPTPLEEMIEGSRFDPDDWENEDVLDDGVTRSYFEGGSVEVLSLDPALRSRRVISRDGMEKMEYTAESPVNLLAALTGRVTLDLSWMEEHYNHVPDANHAFVITDGNSGYVSEGFDALYAKEDGVGYVLIGICNSSQAVHSRQSYLLYDNACYYTNAGGLEFLITVFPQAVRAECLTDYAEINLQGAYLTQEEVEDILDNLSLRVEG